MCGFDVAVGVFRRVEFRCAGICQWWWSLLHDSTFHRTERRVKMEDGRIALREVRLHEKFIEFIKHAHSEVEAVEGVGILTDVRVARTLYLALLCISP